MPLGPGQVFAGYTIERLLGSGGMGEVYLAAHPRLPRPDAIKVLPADVSTDPEFRDRFNREADLAAKLFHPSVVGVHDRGEFDGQLWIAMDYVEGTDAGQLLKARYPNGMPEHDVCAIVTAVASALDYANQRGLLHRDVKPANILLAEPEDSERRVLLADFGIARQLTDVSGLTATNMTVGTMAYAAPEQLMGSDLDGRADQYALAATAFQLLTGDPPYQHSNPVAVISQHLNATPPRLSARRPELAHLDEVLSKALAKDPSDRFDRSRDFATALRERAHLDADSDRSTALGLTVTAPKAGTQTQVAISRPPRNADKGGTRPDAEPSLTAPTNQRRRRRMMLVGAAAATVAIAAISATIYVVERTDSTAPEAGPAASLDGTYHLVSDTSKETTNGAPNPDKPKTDDDRWWAFRSLCTSTGCVATGTELDAKDHAAPATPAVTSVWHFTDNHWQMMPLRSQHNLPQCLGVEGKVVPGARTEVLADSLEPQPGGSLRGISTSTAITNECGEQGRVDQIPILATRVGDVPPSLSVADPASVPSVSTPTSTVPPAPGPVLDGTYRLDYDNADQTVDGEATSSDAQKETHWSAFRSSCTSTRCVATGGGLSDNNRQEPSGHAKEVLQFIDGRWSDTPYLQDPQPCESTYNGPPGTIPGGNATDVATTGLSLEPQPDGTLRGIATHTVIDNGCGEQGEVFKTPVVATRVGDVPPAAVLADPALFQS